MHYCICSNNCMIFHSSFLCDAKSFKNGTSAVRHLALIWSTFSYYWRWRSPNSEAIFSFAITTMEYEAAVKGPLKLKGVANKEIQK